jgi:hypothetical protein
MRSTPLGSRQANKRAACLEKDSSNRVRSRRPCVLDIVGWPCSVRADGNPTTGCYWHGRACQHGFAHASARFAIARLGAPRCRGSTRIPARGYRISDGVDVRAGRFASNDIVAGVRDRIVTSHAPASVGRVLRFTLATHLPAPSTAPRCSNPRSSRAFGYARTMRIRR